MRTETLRVSASEFRVRVIGLWERVLRLRRRTPRRLRLCESLALGERRFVAVVEFEAARFLVGGTPSSMVLLSRLSDAGDRAQGEAEPEPASWNTANAATAVARKRRGETC
jgi:flagellar biogenesis protein FliO